MLPGIENSQIPAVAPAMVRMVSSDRARRLLSSRNERRVWAEIMAARRRPPDRPEW